MNFEQPPIPENKNEAKEPIEEKVFSFASEEEFKRLANLNVEDPEDIKFMEEKGISFDSGDIIIEIDGKKQMMTTRKDDFGTVLSLETIEKKYGKEKSDEYGGPEFISSGI